MSLHAALVSKHVVLTIPGAGMDPQYWQFCKRIANDSQPIHKSACCLYPGLIKNKSIRFVAPSYM